MRVLWFRGAGIVFIFCICLYVYVPALADMYTKNIQYSISSQLHNHYIPVGTDHIQLHISLLKSWNWQLKDGLKQVCRKITCIGRPWVPCPALRPIYIWPLGPVVHLHHFLVPILYYVVLLCSTMLRQVYNYQIQLVNFSVYSKFSRFANSNIVDLAKLLAPFLNAAAHKSSHQSRPWRPWKCEGRIYFVEDGWQFCFVDRSVVRFVLLPSVPFSWQEG